MLRSFTTNATQNLCLGLRLCRCAAASKFAETRRCELVPNAHSPTATVPRTMSSRSIPAGNECPYARWFSFPTSPASANLMPSVACSTEQVQAAMTD